MRCKIYANKVEEKVTLHDLRRNYLFGSMERGQLPVDPFVLFHQWWDELSAASADLLPEWFERNAMTLSTSGEDGSVKSRVVLLKAVDTGFCFFTNYDSSKGEQLSRNPKAAVQFFWPCFERQVRIEGIVSKTSEEFSDQYFQARPRSSQLGAIASPQSRVIDATYDLQHKVDELEKAYDGKIIPRPSNWGGYRLSPTMIEFWQGRPSRLHDRFRYLRESTTSPWAIDRLAP